MKKSIWAVFGLLISTLIWAANSDIKMVTYFPTRYMIYQDVTVKGPMEVGIGQYDEDKVQLDVAKDVTMTHGRVADSTTLTLTGADVDINVDINSEDAVGQSITSGSGSTDTRGTLVLNAGFEKEVDGITDKVSFVGGVQSIETDHKATLTALTLGTKAFPRCSADGNQISWKKLNIGGTEGVFLVCGTGETLEQSCEENPNQQKCCDTNHPACETWSSSAKRCVAKTCDPGFEWYYTVGAGGVKNYQCVCTTTCYKGQTEEQCNAGGKYWRYITSGTEVGCCKCNPGLAEHEYEIGEIYNGMWCIVDEYALGQLGWNVPGGLRGTVSGLNFSGYTCKWDGHCDVPNYVWKSVAPSHPLYGQQNEHCYPPGATKAYGYTCTEVGTVGLGRFCIGSNNCSY